MTPPRQRPPSVADERAQLMGWYDLQRAIVHLECEGLSEADAHRAVPLRGKCPQTARVVLVQRPAARTGR